MAKGKCHVFAEDHVPSSGESGDIFGNLARAVPGEMTRTTTRAPLFLFGTTETTPSSQHQQTMGGEAAKGQQDGATDLKYTRARSTSSRSSFDEMVRTKSWERKGKGAEVRWAYPSYFEVSTIGAEWRTDPT